MTSSRSFGYLPSSPRPSWPLPGARGYQTVVSKWWMAYSPFSRVRHGPVNVVGTITARKVRFKARVGPSDFDAKAREIAGSLRDGRRVSVTIRFNAAARSLIAHEIVERVSWLAEGIGHVEETAVRRRSVKVALAPDESPPPPLAGGRVPRRPLPVDPLA